MHILRQWLLTQLKSRRRAIGLESEVDYVYFCKYVGSKYSSHLDAAPEYGRALSLLSSNSWTPCGPESMALNQIQENETCVSQPLPTMHGIPEGVPLSSSELWLHQPPSAHPPLPGNTNFPEIQLFITPYEETDLYSNIMN